MHLSGEKGGIVFSCAREYITRTNKQGVSANAFTESTADPVGAPSSVREPHLCCKQRPRHVSSCILQQRSSSRGADLPDISTAMKGLLSTAREGGEVLRTWAAYKAGDKAALPKLFELAQGGNSRAQNVVGYLLDHGEGVKKDSAAAAAYFSAASSDYPLARYNLAVLTLLGRGVPKDETKAMEMFESSVKDASVDLAAVRLSLYYLNKGDHDKAWTWANEGANRGNVTAYYLLGRMLYERGGTKRHTTG